ncbi:MAG: AAA15 family ATPase/GTPase [Sulfurimonas sp.]|jgi:AAA15 family ATPase/GTPase
MDKHLLTEIEIKNFKCFKDFKADGFKRVNLIGGKNNVGKTAFMEACFVNVRANSVDKFAKSIVTLSLVRNIIEHVRESNRKEQKYHLEKTKHYSTISNLRKLEFKINYADGIKEYYFNIDEKIVIINVNEFSFKDDNSFNNDIYLSNDVIPNIMLKTFFGEVQKKNKVEILYKHINEFDENIVDFQIIGGDKPQCKTLDGEYRDINEFGDGLKHYISIICSLYACSDGYLFVDELDNGIHWTQVDKLWEIILKISKEQNVQVFATTHSKECIESYARVSKKLEDKDIAFIELGKNENILESITYNYQEVISQVSEHQDMRGW